MTELLPYAVLSLVSVVILLIFYYVANSIKKTFAGLGDRIDLLETELNRMQNSLERQSAKNTEEIGQKARQIKEEIRTALQTSMESVCKKISENEGLHKSRLDAVAAQLSALKQSTPGEAVKPAENADVNLSKTGASQENVHGKARRLARLIVSDIALYNRKNVEEGVKTGNFHDLLAHDIREARALYSRRIPEEIRNSTTYLDEAFAELIEKTKQELGL